MAKQTTVRLCRTFIEVQDGSELMNLHIPRSFSEPCLLAVSSKNDFEVFGPTKAYIKDLSDKFASLDGDVRCAKLFFESSDQGADVAGDLCNPTVDKLISASCQCISPDTASDFHRQVAHFETEDPEVQLTRCVIQTLEHNIIVQEPPNGIATDPPTINTSLAELLMKVKADAWQASASTFCQSGPSGSPLSWADASEDCVDGGVVAAPSTGGCSRGSVGHPELCNRPCLYFAAGTCTNGKDCDYCHMVHSKRPAHLDKQHREMLRSMSAQEWASLVMPILRRKLESVNHSPETLSILADIASFGGVQVGSEPAAMPRRSQRMLVLTLRSMSLKALLSAVQRCLAQHDQQLEAMFDALLRRCLSSLAFQGVQIAEALRDDQR